MILIFLNQIFGRSPVVIKIKREIKDAALRELYEETGYEAKNYKYIEKYIVKSHKKNILFSAYMMKSKIFLLENRKICSLLMQKNFVHFYLFLEKAFKELINLK